MIEKALKTIGDWISKETESRKYPKGELLELSESLQALKAEIARQSVKSGEVQEAIEHLEYWRKNKYKWEYKYVPCGNDINLAITALQAYQPTISKTETTSCELLNHNMNYKKCSSCNRLIHVYVNKPNYCPNCGRKLKGE